MSISISSVSVGYSNSFTHAPYQNHFSASLIVNTSGAVLDHVEVVNSGGLIDVTYLDTFYGPEWVFLATNTYMNAMVTVRAIGVDLSISDNYTIEVQVKDRWAPVISSFTIVNKSNSKTIDLNYEITHVINDSGGYLVGVSEINSIDAVVWGTPETYTFASNGLKDIYLWAKDTNDNVSAPVHRTVLIDDEAPAVQFILPDFSPSRVISIQSINVNDDTLVRFAITQSDEVPTTWSNDQPATITVDTDGDYTFYCWVIDEVGNTAYSSDTISVVLARPVVSVTSDSTFSSATVNFTFTATDVYDISGYYVSHINTYISANKLPFAPANYTFTGLSQGTEYNFILYFWAENNLGNINELPVEVPITILIPDTIAPTIIEFTMPIAHHALEVPITGISVQDNVGVAGYFLSEYNSTPMAGYEGWISTLPTSYTFTSIGFRRLYLWIKDDSNNISSPAWCDVSIADVIIPVIKSFKIPAVYDLLTIPIESLIATDNIAISGYYISESLGAPIATSYLWSPFKPTEYQFKSFGFKTLYAYAKDSNNNVSQVAEASCFLEEITVRTIDTERLSGKEMLSQHLSMKPISVQALLNYMRAKIATEISYINTVVIPAHTQVYSFRTVIQTQYGLEHSTIDTIDRIIGISLKPGIPGSDIIVQYKDIVENSEWNLQPGQTVFPGLNGLISHSNPNNIKAIGIAVSSTSVLLKLN